VISTVARDTGALLSRWLIHMRRDVMSLSMGLMQPLFFFLFGGLFRGVLGGDKTLGSDVDYLNFYTPGVLAFTILTNAILGGIPIVFDRENGFIDKILSAPISRTAIVASRFIYVTFYSLLQTLVVLAVGYAIGFRFQGGVSVGVALAGIFAFGALLTAGITALSLALAFQAAHHPVFFTITGFVTTPVLVLSSAFVPLARIPEGWMRFVASWNPLTHAIEPIRALVCGGGGGDYLFHAGYLAAFDVVCFAIAVQVIRRRLD
jgi:ABC-2 type transport system permease protein